MASSFFIQLIVLAECLQTTGGFAHNWPLARAKFTSVRPSVEDVTLPVLEKYNYDVKTAFYTPLVCLSLVL
jgi:hypothetical protein